MNWLNKINEFVLNQYVCLDLNMFYWIKEKKRKKKVTFICNLSNNYL